MNLFVFFFYSFLCFHFVYLVLVFISFLYISESEIYTDIYLYGIYVSILFLFSLFLQIVEYRHSTEKNWSKYLLFLFPYWFLFWVLELSFKICYINNVTLLQIRRFLDLIMKRDLKIKQKVKNLRTMRQNAKAARNYIKRKKKLRNLRNRKQE